MVGGVYFEVKQAFRTPLRKFQTFGEVKSVQLLLGAFGSVAGIRMGTRMTRMTRIWRVYTDLICVNPLNPRHPRSHCCRLYAVGVHGVGGNTSNVKENPGCVEPVTRHYVGRSIPNCSLSRAGSTIAGLGSCVAVGVGVES